MENICDKIIPITKFENMHIYIKLGLWAKFLGEIFCGDIDIVQLNIWPIN